MDCSSSTSDVAKAITCTSKRRAVLLVADKHEGETAQAANKQGGKTAQAANEDDSSDEDAPLADKRQKVLLARAPDSAPHTHSRYRLLMRRER